MKHGPASKSPSERFWDKVKVKQGCWPWRGAKDSNGYGLICIGTSRDRGKKTKAHRVSYQMHFGKIPEGMCVCHTCDNPECTNPGHLFLASHSENMADMVSKKRHAYGSRNGQAKLCELDVCLIRELKHIKNKKLAAFFGVSDATISQVLSCQTWKHV